MKGKNREKFPFDIEFQSQIIHYLLTDKLGYRVLNLIEPEYFTLITDALIFKGIKKFSKKSKIIPKSSAILKEILRELLNSKEYSKNILDSDVREINQKIETFYESLCPNGEYILDKTTKFARYVKVKDLTENFDAVDFEKWEPFSKELSNAINFASTSDDRRGTFLIRDSKDRQFQRLNNVASVPTPFWQMNRTLNGRGFDKGSVICFIGPQKKAKTTALVNFGRCYLARKKKVVFFDLENGQIALATRFEQALIRKSKEEVQSGEYDSALNKTLRKYKRLGAECYIIRLPSLITTTADFQREIDRIYVEHGIKFDIAIVDYVGNMGCLSGNKEDFGRISEATVDLKNFSLTNGFDLLLTATHVVRGALKRYATKFLTEDISKCIDIPRHVDALYSLQQNPQEKEGKVMRIEVLDQRDGIPEGQMYFHIDLECQRIDEFTQAEVKELAAQLRDLEEEDKPSAKYKNEDLD